MKEAAKILWDRFVAGEKEYEKSVRQMSDDELKDHCFGDDDWEESDFCIQVWKERGFELPNKTV